MHESACMYVCAHACTCQWLTDIQTHTYTGTIVATAELKNRVL